ncbi:MAG: hypothetical protein ACRC68_00575 [Clostridium sp.]
MSEREKLYDEIVKAMCGKSYVEGKYTYVPFEEDVIEIEMKFKSEKEVIDYIIDNNIFEEMQDED